MNPLVQPRVGGSSPSRSRRVGIEPAASQLGPEADGAAIDRVAYAIIVSWGWRRTAIALAAGAASSLAQPPFFAFPVLWLSFPVLVWLLDGAVTNRGDGRVRRLVPSFAAGWCFGFGYFLAGLWWIGGAFLVEADVFGWLLPFAVMALPAGLALFWGLGAAAAQLVWSDDWRRIFALAAGLGAAEWLRGHLLTGFPWNAIGYALTAGEPLMQSAGLFGLYGLNVVAACIFAAPAVLAPATQRGRNLALPAIAVAAVAGLALYGLLRLHSGAPSYAPNTMVRIVQPALDQLQKWEPENKDEVLRSYVSLSSPPGSPLVPGTILVWPESAFPFELRDDAEALAAIAGLLPEGTVLVTGAYRVERFGAEDRRVFNSIYVINAEGTIQATYDKLHLVPFGEYLPIQGLLKRIGLRQLVRSGFSAGTTRRSIDLGLAPPFVPLICYEIIFSDAVLREEPRPGFLLNVTNDGWFGKTIGPHQHFHQARVRAVEEALPLVRAANTGISAVIDGHGRILGGTRLGEATMIESRLPAAGARSPHARWRSRAFILSFGLCLLICATTRVQIGRAD